MFSFKDGKTMKPHFDYYVETDLDTIDDQPIDFSKRYDDQLADDVCGSSSRKKRHLSTPSENAPNKMPGDELKVYCIEGTPLLISSASSLCDLHEIDALVQASENEALKDQAEEKKPCFQESYSNPREDASPHAKCDELLEYSKGEQVQSESKEENTPSRTDETFSKASSPLMFSRSSSICSLNSFEQHSIIDDRSSVSMFSNLASGIISPSEIPDSPGEAMSPFIPKRQSEFIFPPNDNQGKSMDPVLAKLKMTHPPFTDQDFEDTPEDLPKVYNVTDEVFEDMPEDRNRPKVYNITDEVFEDNPDEDNLKVYNDEGDCCSMTSSLSALSIQTRSSLNRVSVAVFHKTSFPVVQHKSSIRISCSMVTGNAELQSIKEDQGKETALAENGVQSFGGSKNGIQSFGGSKNGIQSFDASENGVQSFGASENAVKSFGGFDKGVQSFGGFEDCMMDDDEDRDEKINFSLVEEEEDCKDMVCSHAGDFGFEDRSDSFEKPAEDGNFLRESESPDYSKDNSEDEDCDALLEECIKSGMPTNNEPQLSKQTLNNTCASNQELKPQEKIEEQNVSHSDCDTSDSEGGDLLKSCIQLGMPQNSHNKEPVKSNDLNNFLNSSNTPQNFSKVNVGEVSDDEDYDPLLQQVIQMGTPKNEPKEFGHNNTSVSNTYSSSRQNLGYRDNRPDGTSDDEDDDDDILTECIQAGMPKPKIYESKRPYTLPVKNPCVKPQLHSHRQSPASNSRSAYLSSFAGPHQPLRKSPTADHRTVNHKPNQQRKSPTKHERATLLPSYHNRPHQRQPHKRSPSAEDRATPLSSIGQQSHRRSPARMLPFNIGQHRKSVVSDRMLFSNPGNQPVMFSNPASQVSSNRGNQPTTFSTSGNQPTTFTNSGNLLTMYTNLGKHSTTFSNPGTQPKMYSNHVNQPKRMSDPSSDNFHKKYQYWVQDFPDVTCTYRTEDTPILSPSASVSDLSTLSFSEDRMYLDSSLNNSRNSDCSSESEEDELLRQCIKSGMPSEKRALA